MKRFLAILLLAAFVILCVACGETPAPLPTESTPTAETTPAETTAETSSAKIGYFDEVTHEPVGELTYKGATRQETEDLSAEAKTLAAANETERFGDVYRSITATLYSLYTDMSLASIESTRDAGNFEAAERYRRLADDLNRANDTFLTAMHEIALSDCPDALRATVDEETFDGFVEYSPENSETLLALFDEEKKLEQDYEALLATANPTRSPLKFAMIYVKLVNLRKEIASVSGYDSYAEYAYEVIYARDYTPEDAKTIWKMAKNEIIRFYAGIYDQISDAFTALGGIGDTVCPTEDDLLAALEAGALALSPEVYDAFCFMKENDLCDLAVDEKKLGSSYTTYLPDYGVPYLFITPMKSYYDYLTVFHEFGHYLAYFYHGSDPIFYTSDYDLAELQSQGMEAMFTMFYEDVFGEYANAVRMLELYSMVDSVLQGALYDEFQQRVFAEEDLTPARVGEIYAECWTDFGFLPYDGYQNEWAQVIHNFESPFYYISYAVSALPSLDLMARVAEDSDAALDLYLRIAAIDSELFYLSEALEEVGLADPFSDGYGGTLTSALRNMVRTSIAK